MTLTALRIPKKELRPGLKRYEDTTTTPAWDLYLDDTLVASEYVSQTEALMELDLAAWYALFGETSLAPNIPISDEALGIALTVFHRLFATIKVQEKAHTALEKIIRAGIYTIRADGSLSVLASSGKGKSFYAVKVHTALRDDREERAENDARAYQVTMECECRDFYTRAHEHGGICKHVAARLLLFLAQLGAGHLKHLRDALDTASPTTLLTVVEPALNEQLPQSENNHEPSDHPTDENPMAFVSLDATDLLAMLFLAARTALPVAFRADDGTLGLLAGSLELSFGCRDGSGAAAVRLEPATLTALSDQLRPVAKSLGALMVFVSPSDGSIVLSADGDTPFSAIAEGVTIPIGAPAPTPAPVPEPKPTTDSSTVEALFELFTLLEQHEPDWYPRRHSRLASDALHRAGRIA